MPSTLHRAGAALALALTASLAVPTAASAAPATTAAPPAAATGHAASGPDRDIVTSDDGRIFITDDRGRALQLRGFNAGKWQNDRVTAEDVAAMADQGFNFLRLIVQWEYFEPEQGRYDEAYFDYVESVLDAADREGVHVMLDMHQDVYGPAFEHGGIPEWATRTDGLPYEMDPSNWFNDYFQPAVMRAFTHLYEDADLRAAQEQLWVKLATRLEGHESLLGYDLFNEPFGEFREGEDLATASGRIEATQLSDMYDRLISAIRTVDDDAWLFVEPTVLVGYGVPTQLRSFDDPRAGEPRIGYAPHFYNTGVEEGGDWPGDDGFVENYEAAISAYPTANGMPTIVGEWGVPNSRTPGNAALVTAQVDSMERFASGWAMFYWCRSASGGYCALDADGTAAPGNEPAFGPYARAIAGTPGSEHFDAATGEYALSYTAGAGPSEVWVPNAAYVQAPDVEISGGKAHYDAKKQTLRITAKPGSAVSLSFAR